MQQRLFEFELVVVEAIDKALARVAPKERAQALRALRVELERCLAEAPVTTDVVDAIGLRARLAAAFDQVIGPVMGGH